MIICMLRPPQNSVKGWQWLRQHVVKSFQVSMPTRKLCWEVLQIFRALPTEFPHSYTVTYNAGLSSLETSYLCDSLIAWDIYSVFPRLDEFIDRSPQASDKFGHIWRGIKNTDTTWSLQLYKAHFSELSHSYSNPFRYYSHLQWEYQLIIYTHSLHWCTLKSYSGTLK